MKIYISGPITGHEHYREYFAEVEKMLKNQGYEVVNPTTGETEGDTWINYMKRDIQRLLECDAIYMLPGWHESKGATLELQIAQALRFYIFFAQEIKQVPDIEKINP